MSARQKKYIFVNGVMKLNPDYVDPSALVQVAAPPAEPSTTAQPLQVISSMNDVADATDAQVQATGVPMQLAPSTIDTIQQMQSDAFVNQFAPSDQSNIVDGLTEAFVEHEVPLGMINKLRALSNYRLHFIIDDSGSMR
jgi:hypothetical protein